MLIENLKEVVDKIKKEDLVSDEELAKKTGVSLSTIKNILSGRTVSAHPKTIRSLLEKTDRNYQFEKGKLYTYLKNFPEGHNQDLAKSTVADKLDELVKQSGTPENLSDGLKLIATDRELRKSLNITKNTLEILAMFQTQSNLDDKLDKFFWIQLLLLLRSRFVDI
ncbi:MAG: helix-turn-helix domain-containing protein [Calditrichaeota bacterium]|nr:helix-turn-helix domain-containing protein [Calditrichota bacterium]